MRILSTALILMSLSAPAPPVAARRAPRAAEVDRYVGSLKNTLRRVARFARGFRIHGDRLMQSCIGGKVGEIRRQLRVAVRSRAGLIRAARAGDGRSARRFRLRVIRAYLAAAMEEHAASSCDWRRVSPRRGTSVVLKVEGAVVAPRE